MTEPASVPADGFQKFMWVPTLSAPAFPTVAELTALSVVDVSCYIVGGGFQNALEEQSIDDPRICSRQTFERPGKFKRSLTLMYVHNPATPGDNVAYLTLLYLTTGFIVARYGVPFDDVIAAGDITDTYPAQCGKQHKVPSEDNSVLKVSQKIFITGTVNDDAVVLA